jgi:hydrogenase maturation protease
VYNAGCCFLNSRHPACGRALLAGIGSPFGADTLGWQAVEALRQSGWAERFPAWEWRIETLDRPGGTLLEWLKGHELAILVDSLQAPGDQPCLLSLEALATETAPLSGHKLGLAETLLLGERLGMLPARLLIIGLPSEVDPGFSTLEGMLAKALCRS